ncbi:unnamed protein product [Rotaria socialis]|uniref:Calcineurin-like phosphoesterase domain-containing protein n=1 Tax=Rotaria socialis TaxID=392032 RepID=A0A820YWE6_9BILA|nr:unnamed protein product [Rotaria socialis]CAF3632392.1 unnamed protein product [Rotaria socialis]CAF4134755.1 unnamed protein product [Rotaria socialis]CAF4269015.1 unnamed protein product [Rotaria socialis]CAF4556161.1 unnamed protein product [Rotaria socialis]
MATRANKTTRIVCISDTHSRYDFVLPSGDILVHTGDFSKSGLQDEVEYFITWLKSLTKYRLKIFIAGNHDHTLDPISYERCWKRWHRGRKQNCAPVGHLIHDRSLATNFGIIYLEEQLFVDNVTGLSFYGSSPYEPASHNGTFYFPINSVEIMQACSRIPNNVDVLLTHCPPASILDTTITGEHVGCDELLSCVNVAKPRLHVFGHIHEAHGRIDQGSTIFVNASICNRKYQPVQAPIVIDLELKEKT